MEPLLINSLYIAVRYSLGFQDFKMLTEWLGVYDDISNNKRELLPALVIELMRNKANGSEVFKSYLLLDLIQTVANKQIQERLLCKILPTVLTSE